MAHPLDDLLAAYLRAEGETFTQVAQALKLRHHLPHATRTLRRVVAAYYADGTNSAVETPQPEVLQPDEPFPEQPLAASPLEEHPAYLYREEQDRYVFFLPGTHRPFSLTGATVRELKRRYSDWNGKPETLNALCRSFSIPRKLLAKIKTALGWTHDSEPFTEEEIAARSEEDLLADAKEQKKFRLEQRLQLEKLKAETADAEKWRQFKAGVLAPLQTAFGDVYTAPVAPVHPPINEGYRVVMVPYDLHYGKYAWGGETRSPYDRQTARERLLSATDTLLSDVSLFPIEEFVVPVGSDFFHVDTDRATTTGGTPQDCDGTPAQIMAEGFALMLEYVERLRAVANVRLVLAAGNHDRLLSSALLLYLQGYYRQASDVVIASTHQPRQYVRYGQTMLGFTHGDGIKPDQLPLLMQQETERYSPHTLWFVGHLHHTKHVDLTGSLLIQLPSLSGADRWHERNGYSGSVQQMTAYLICPLSGLRATFYTSF